MLHLETWGARDRRGGPGTPGLVRLAAGGAWHAVRPRDPGATLCGRRIPRGARATDVGTPTCAHCVAALPQRPVILVLDDALGVAALLCATLEEAGYAARAEDEARLLATAAEQRPAVILIGMVSAGDAVDELCRALKAEASTAAIPLVLVTGTPLCLLGETLAMCPCDDAIRKPWDATAVLTVIRRHVSAAARG
jgi:CheY-like chemotaxis protein